VSPDIYIYVYKLYSRKVTLTVLLCIAMNVRLRLSDTTVHTRSRLNDINITEYYCLYDKTAPIPKFEASVTKTSFPSSLSKERIGEEVRARFN